MEIADGLCGGLPEFPDFRGVEGVGPGRKVPAELVLLRGPRSVVAGYDRVGCEGNRAAEVQQQVEAHGGAASRRSFARATSFWCLAVSHAVRAPPPRAMTPMS
ncbi:hypothetical protein IQ60_00110 [Streptomyces europaeiscabiei]|nr:hypothetical protein IQ60_00110 [Streptomyces europaeiscabiei]